MRLCSFVFSLSKTEEKDGKDGRLLLRKLFITPKLWLEILERSVIIVSRAIPLRLIPIIIRATGYKTRDALIWKLPGIQNPEC